MISIVMKRDGTSLFDSAIAWLTVNYGSSNPEIQRRARRTAAAVILGLIGITLSIVTLLATHQASIAAAPSLAMIALLFCVFAQRTGASIDIITSAVTVIVATLLFGMLLATGGASLGFLIATPVVPALAALTGSRRSVLLWSTMTALVISVVAALTWLDFSFPIQPDPDKVSIAKFSIAIVVIGMIFGVGRILQSDQQRTEKALIESEKLFKQAAHIAALGHYLWDEVEDRCLFASEEYARILGISTDEVLNHYNDSKRDLELVHPDDRAGVLAAYSSFAEPRTGHDIQYRIIRPDGEERFVREIEDPFIDRHGHFIRAVGILQDVTSQHKAQQAIEESEALLRQAVHTAKLGHWSHDDDTDEFLSVSPEYARIFGYTAEEFLHRFPTSKDYVELVHPQDRGKVARAYEERDGGELEYRIIRADGSIRTVVELEKLIPDAPGKHIRYQGTLQDITELRHVQERARELQDVQQELAKNLADARQAAQLVNLGTYTWDRIEGRLVTCSEEYARIHEMSVDEVIKTFNTVEADYRYIHPDDRERIAALEAAAIRDNSGYSASYRMLLPSGRICHLREVCEVEVDGKGDGIRTSGSIQDVSEQVELEELLHQSRKMEAVGQLTSGIAHDFNNILAIVMGNLELALERMDADSDDREFLLEAMRGTQQGADLNKQLLTFSRQQVLAEKVLHVNEIIRSMSSLLVRTLGEEIEIETIYGSEIGLCKLDPALLESAILNLAINARDAMIGGGKLSIETSVSPLNEFTAGVGAADDMIRISISDSGTGMSAKVKERALEPFFTTKSVGAGSGLGLSMVYSFVAHTGGHIGIDTAPGKGTTVHMLLPLADRRDKTYDATSVDEMPMALDGEVVLVVEDQSAVRNVVVRQLGKLGYNVLQAENGNVALKILENQNSIDLILSDMVMPGGMGGEELVSKAKAIQPDIKVLLMSGNPARSNRGDEIQAPLLQKPFRQADLARAVRDQLDKR